MDEFIYSNGINIDTGTYAIDPMRVDDLDALLRKEPPPENINELSARAQKPKSLGVKEGVDPKCLNQAGWGVIFADDADPAVEKALQPLLAWRHAQAGRYFQKYSGDKGFKVGKDDKNSFLARYGAGPGPADPDKVPYYLLIVGSPDKIPYTFQSQLDVQYAVGRIDFKTPADYASYAASVVAAESGQVKLPRRATFFGVSHETPDTATTQSRTYLVDPLLKALSNESQWAIDPPLLDKGATKAALAQHLGGSATPALLFTAGHGLVVPPASKSKLAQNDYQGALICADWPGPGHSFTEKDYFFAGQDVGKDANLLGLIALFFACFGAGTPQLDAFTRLQRKQLGQQPGPAPQLAPQPFVSVLPQRMLSAPGGGALAVIGHVERTWPSAFLWKAAADGTLPPQTAAFESTLRRLMNGYPVGAAVEYLNQKYAELAADLKVLIEDAEFPGFNRGVELANIWMAANDAQWFTVVGDPAVRLPVVDATAMAPRPQVSAIQVVTADAPPAQPAVTSQSIAPVAATNGASNNGVGASMQPPTTANQTKLSGDPDLFASPFTPPPVASPELDELQRKHPALYSAYVEHIREGYKNNNRVFAQILRAFLLSHYSTVIMYWILFAVGVGSIITAIVVGLLYDQALAGAAFAGVSVIAFISYFIGRSTQSVEENLIYITWLGMIYNSYWTYLAWITDRDSALAELSKATTDGLQQLAQMLERHAQSVKGRFRFGKGDEAKPTP